MPRAASIRDEVVQGAALLPMRVTLRAILVIVMLYTIALIGQVGYAVYRHGDRAPDQMRELLLDAFARSREPHVALLASDVLYRPVFHWTKVDQAVQDAIDARETSVWREGSPVAVTYPYALTAMYATKLIGVRLSHLLLGAGVILVLVGVSLVDGLVARQIRKVNVERESATIFHHAQRLRKASVPLAALVYCGLPQPLDPAWVVGPMAATLVLGVWLQAKYFKKYL